MMFTPILHKHCLPNNKIPHIISSLISTVHTIHIPTIQHTCLPLIIKNINSITLHTSTHHPIKTNHNSNCRGTSQMEHLEKLLIPNFGGWSIWNKLTIPKFLNKYVRMETFLYKTTRKVEPKDSTIY